MYCAWETKYTKEWQGFSNGPADGAENGGILGIGLAGRLRPTCSVCNGPGGSASNME